MGTSLDLGISIADMWPHVTELFTILGPFIAFALGLLVVPKLIGVIKSVFAHR
ncbi:hypothetical protein [Desulforamulus aeronauticus]|uniref:Uncharacterized protein n=1 Tax=Desulforamulus aeronauticus DSM 10349 TaxID=1121421 RepID=A0A1M6WFL5_9FIRM|nr:hypothetical protein [Desulforamulus aeronauticus]SHK92406.1 hypothetical protein SAMN02745123_03602 [Desulforamulus aeronauticus DSM 10349]